MTKRLVSLVVAAIAVLAFAGCFHESSDDDNANTTPTTPPATAPTTTPTTPPTTTPSTTPTTPDSGGDRSDEEDVNGIITTVKSYFDGGRRGNPQDWCGQQSDRLLEENFGSGGLQACLSSEVANKPDSDIPEGDDLDFENSITLNGDEATAEPKTRDGSTQYTIELVYEGANGGWAVDSIDNNS